ncbi:M20 family metallopeptidase [Tyzzerella sp. OttesenSCG-928-J15]|nr:M20 family metallopeptidase [Tyzzerella sp. OttesenSCG-928-J15]
MLDYLSRANELKDELTAHRKFIHKNAEVGYKLPKTVEYVKSKLIEMGYEPKEICESGILATVGKEGGKVFLLRSDMDALPMNEETGLDFACTDGACHSCGHDLHTATLLGAAKLLKENESNLQGMVKLMFQPAEEIFWGANAMIENGIMENPKVDAALAAHVTTGSQSGHVHIKEGPVMSSCNGFKITIHGKGSHGASPQAGVDPINIGVHIHLALQEIITREVSFGNGALITIGSFSSGTAPNIIPETAVMQGTIRTYNEEIRGFLVERLKEVVDLTARKFRGSAEVEILSDVPALVNDAGLANTIARYTEELLGAEYVKEGKQGNGSEDFACIAKLVPGVMVHVGATDLEKDDPIYYAHHPKVIYHDTVLPMSSALYAYCATKWLEENK